MASSRHPPATYDTVPLRTVPMKVIVCGLHRTGTLSMRFALKRLGFNDAYHMQSAMARLETDPQQWIRAFEGKYTDKREPFGRADWDALLGDSQACVDVPAAFFACELAEIYPDAKVVILNRDAEAWYVSTLNSVYKAMRPASLGRKLLVLYLCLFDPLHRGFIQFAISMNRNAMGYDHGAEKDVAIAWYHRQYDEFRRGIPEERRIEYHISDGWGPLCKHLGVPVPTDIDEETGEVVEAPFPRLNDTASMMRHRDRTDAVALRRANANILAFAGRVAVAAALGYGGYVMWKTRLAGR